MTQDKTGGPAFPLPHVEALDRTWSGMTLRDWFAGQALEGILSNPSRLDSIANTAEGAYTIADAMLAARNGGNDT